MCVKKAAIPAVVPSLLSSLQEWSLEGKQGRSSLRQQRGGVLSSPQPLFWSHLSHFEGCGQVQTRPILPQGKSQRVCIKATLMIQILVILELPLQRAMGRALGQSSFALGLNQRQGCGPQWGATQRSPKTRNKGLESVCGEVAPPSPTLPQMLQ